ncbi:MAG: hydantoinase/oxoprolinase family protein, partial [Candidatus Rokuibacteriota bacterium]
QSAGAEPGPACYGRGGDRPTVTDASVLLGYLNPESFAGGSLRLDVRAAERAVATVAGPLRLDAVATAAGIHRVVNARMADQIRLMTIQRGHDPRGFTLVLLGGAGPVHGVALAEELGLADVLVPEAPGVLSALGLLAASVEHEHARTHPTLVEAADLAAVNGVFRELDAAGRARMREEAVPAAEVEVAYSADMRYVGQAYELPVPIAAPLEPAALAAAQTAFHAIHERVYGYARTGQAVEFVNLRAVHAYRLPAPRIRPPARPRGALAEARVGERPVHFPPAGFVATPVYVRARLPLGARIPGPAIVEQADTTIVVPPGWTISVEESGNLRIRRAGETER